MKIRQEIYGSSAIQAFEYDSTTKVLTILFVRGNVSYEYPGIPEEVIKNWLQAESMGKYFNKYIKNYVG